MLAFVLFSWVKIQVMLADEEEFFAPAPGGDGIGGYGYG
jgi:hypothetical protein